MAQLSQCYVFIVCCCLVKLEEIEFNAETSTMPIDIFEDDDPTARSPRVSVLGALANDNLTQLLTEVAEKSTKDMTVVSQSFLLDADPLATMALLCQAGEASHAKVIVAGRPTDEEDSSDLVMSALAYVSDFYRIPMITIGSRENIFSDKVRRSVWMVCMSLLFRRRCMSTFFVWSRRICTKPTLGSASFVGSSIRKWR